MTAAHAIGFETVQLFTKNNNQWHAPPLKPEQIEAFRTAVAQTGILDPVAHASYLINLASPDDLLWEKSVEALLVELQRCSMLGIADLVLHPGSHMGAGEVQGLKRVAAALDVISAQAAGLPVTIDLETTAGQGTSLGYRFGQIRTILEETAEPHRLGVCVDTCHIFAAGYSLDPRERYDETIRELEETVGLDRVRVWHLNDSERERGSRVDRHAGIGAGKMGLEPFRLLLHDLRFRSCPLILETPKGIAEGEDLDRRNLRILRQLVEAGPLDPQSDPVSPSRRQARASRREPGPASGEHDATPARPA